MEMNWLDVIEFFKKPAFRLLAEALEANRKNGIAVLPARSNVFKALQLTPFDQVKVVILGQDPYPNPEHAMGLAFSVPSETKPLPPTLVNIAKELKEDVGCETFDPDLSRWAEQGVLLLNASLTVEQGKSDSHANYWSPLVNEIITKLSSQREHLVFILWGSRAQAKAQFIDEGKHHIILSPHPSPLAAYRGFFGSKPFSRTNAYLREHRKDPINW